MHIFKLLLTVLPVPLLLAPVRLNEASPPQLQNMGNSPAMQSYSLPAAQPLGLPTVITVSPTGFDAMPTPTTVAPVAPPSQPQAVVLPASNLMPELTAQLCQHALASTAKLTLLSYGLSQKPGTAALTVAATAADSQAAQRIWPNMQSFSLAHRKLAWSTPHAKEIDTTAKAALRLCGNPAAAASGSGIGRSQVPVERPN